MKTYLFLGDTHGDLVFVEGAAHFARQHAAEVIQVGDWGFVWPGGTQLKQLSKILTDMGVTMRFIDGNHDEHPRLRSYISTCAATLIAPNVIYQPRGSVHEDEDSTRFLFMGGAPSIDRASRVVGRSWWPEETIADADFAIARDAKGPIHVLVTHDAPAFPPGFSPKGSPGYRLDQERSLTLINTLVEIHRPQLHVHGHWHRRYERLHACGTTIVGLDCNLVKPKVTDLAMLLWTRAQ